MPKVRPIEYSFRDVQKHLSVGRSRIAKIQDNLQKRNEILSQIDTIVSLTQKTIKDLLQFKEVAGLPTSLAERTITNEIDLIKKELKKETPKIDYRAAVRAMCNSSTISAARQIGVDYGISIEQTNLVIAKAPEDTALGKLIGQQKLIVARQKLKQVPQLPIAAVQQQEEHDTNYSDEPLPDELTQLLTGK